MRSTKDIIDAYYRHLKNRDRAALLSILSEEIIVTYHSQAGQFPWSGQFFGISGFDTFFGHIHTYLEVINVEIIDSISDHEKTINRCYGSWRYKASGFEVNGSMINAFTVSEDKISAYDVYADTAAFAQGFPK